MSDENQPYLNISGFSKLPMIRQAGAAECGLACLTMIACYHGYNTDISELRRKYPISMRGATLKTIAETAIDIELGSRALHCDVDELKDLRAPCILHWDFDHFVVLKKVEKNHCVIHDPADGVRKVTYEEISKAFTGVALEFTPTQKFKKKNAAIAMKLGDLVKFDGYFRKSFTLGLILSILAELFVLASPFYMQITIDEVLLKGDKSLLNALGIGFGMLVVFMVIANILRQLTFQFLGHILSFDMAARIFQNMMRLPINYFSSRQLGDVQHRVQSIEQIQMFIVQGAPIILMDGLFSILIICLLYAYQPFLATLCLGAMVLYIGWRFATFGLMKRVAGDLIVAEAGQQTLLLETLRAMPTLKMNAMEPIRESGWRNASARKLNAGLRVGNLDILNGAFNQLLFQGLRVAIIFIAAKMALAGEMTVGMISAFIAYYGMYTQRTSSLIEQLFALKLLQVPLKRIADIVLSTPENTGHDGGRGSELKGAVSIQGAYFRYGTADPYVLQNINFDAKPGEFVAIIGPSGAGKTTLLRLIAGLDTPSRGVVAFDGRSTKNWSTRSLRQQIGMVLQEDNLLKGSIAENIALFDPQTDMERVKQAAVSVGIAAEIEAMAMGYETLVGDMGSTLSGGQKQRVLLARALYRDPKILLLDEATSHLDPHNEGIVQDSVSHLGITRIVIAHRPETIKHADKIYMVHNGNLIPVKKDQGIKQMQVVK